MTVLLRPDFPSLATRAIVARELSCTDRHIDRLIAAGRLQRVKLGSRVLITRDSVQALIDRLPAA